MHDRRTALVVGLYHSRNAWTLIRGHDAEQAAKEALLLKANNEAI